ncbi:LysR family transcriptional regulator [Defluviimonas sp. D31]|uniref:LysR family transcriptional regulator n=1 Tax=Defluviimonas sp. D31 TaxID=3083253 RepID=UPI00296F8A31|nr:LysR family transcriptional regulator [Defluviimonas sp. D31]MDW4549574.1 LysR family transcriptional regulator [Defluviimonas sp. D31]
MDHLRAMRLFLRVAELGSLTAASTDAGLARGAASAIVAELERYLGVQLLERTTRKIRLTEEGGRYLARARAILADVAELEEDIGASERRPRGRLRIQIPPGLTRLIVAPALPGFIAQYPGIELEILSRSDLPDFVGMRLDAAVVVGPLPELDLVARPLGHLPALTVAAPAYLERRGTPQVPADLSAHDCVRTISTATGNPVVWRFREDGKDVRMEMPGPLAFESPEAAVAAVRRGGGVLQIASYLVYDDIRSGQLVSVLDPFRPEGPTLQIVHPRHRHKPRRLKVFEDFLSDLNLRFRSRWNIRDTQSPGPGRLVTPSD